MVGVAGLDRNLEVPADQTIDGVPFVFGGWSDGNPNRTRRISFPTANTTLVALYRPLNAVGLSESGEPRPGPVYEAERGRSISATKVRLKGRYTGGGFAAFTAAGQGLTFPVNVRKSGTYAIVLRYAHGETEPLPVILSVDGVVAAEAQLKPTTSWQGWKTASIRVQLPGGPSQVRLELGASGTLNVDSLRIGRVLQEAETATLNGAAAVINPPLPGRLGFVQLRGRNNSADRPTAIEWNVAAETTGTFNLNVRYANGSSETQTIEVLDVDSGNVVSINLPPTGSWSTWLYATAPIALTSGPHKLRLTCSVSSAVAIDSLLLSPPA